jgi:hypothetical protein
MAGNQTSIQELTMIASGTVSNANTYSAPITVLGADSYTVQFFLTGTTAKGTAEIQATLKDAPVLTTDADWDALTTATTFASLGSQIWKSEGNGRVSYRKIRIKWTSTDAGNDGTIYAISNVVTGG